MISRETIRCGFPITLLGEVAEFLDSRRRPITASERIPGPYPYYGANGQQDSVADYIFDEPLILLAEDGGPFDQPDRGIAYAIEGKTWVNNHAHVLRPRDHARLRYLVRVLENYDVTPWITGSTRAKLTKAGAFKIQIPLPALAEQKRIAGILDAADALRAKRREALAQLDTLLQSTFIDMFGDPVTNSMGWHVGRLEDYFSETRAGTCCGPFGSALKKHEYVQDGIPVWGIDNVKPNQFIQERSLFITPAKFAQLRRYSVEPGDILISRAGTVGRMCVAVPTVERSIIGSNLIRLTLNPAAMLPVYFACLYTFCGDRLPDLRASGDDKSYSFLNTTRLKSLVVPLPPLDLQHRFAAIVQSVEQQIASQRAHLNELDTLFTSLQARAFRGDL